MRASQLAPTIAFAATATARLLKKTMEIALLTVMQFAATATARLARLFPARKTVVPRAATASAIHLAKTFTPALLTALTHNGLPVALPVVARASFTLKAAQCQTALTPLESKYLALKLASHV